MHEGLDLLLIEKGETILEIGCGTGKALLELCCLTGNEGKVHGLDLSRGMLQKSRDRLAKSGVAHGVCLLEGDGAYLPYQSGSFNVAFISFTLELFDTPEIPVVLEECQQVLVPGGWLGVVCLLKTDPPGTTLRLYEWLHDKLPAYMYCRPIVAKGMVQAAGFKVDKQQIRSMWGLLVELVVASKE
jgi:demethylmenaquinone methyltransferase/2-methoxy-6-polyprenyl-1,4-benzoquinol methylase